MAFRWTPAQEKLRAQWIGWGRRESKRHKGSLDFVKKIAASGLLHPKECSATLYQAAFDGLGYACKDPGALFMAQAHLWGGWIPLMHFRPDLATKLARKPWPILALAATEPRSGSDFFAMETVAKEGKRGWRISGRKTFVTNGTFAHHLLVFAKLSGINHPRAIGCFAMPRSAAGITVKSMPNRAGLSTADAADVTLKNAEVSHDALLGEPMDGSNVFRLAMEWERSLILSSAPGILERLLENLLADAARKIRSGRPLAQIERFQNSIQTVRDGITEIREAIGLAAGSLDARGNATTASLRAKVKASRTYEEMSRILLQLGGKEAFIAGSELETNFRDSLASSLYSGPNEVLQEILRAVQ